MRKKRSKSFTEWILMEGKISSYFRSYSIFRDIRVDLDINEDQLQRMCRKQGLDSRSDRQQQWDSQRADRYGRGPPRRDAQYGGPGHFPGDGGYGEDNRYGPLRSVAPVHQGMSFKRQTGAVLQ
jgi:hypothetical protein